MRKRILVEILWSKITQKNERDKEKYRLTVWKVRADLNNNCVFTFAK